MKRLLLVLLLAAWAVPAAADELDQYVALLRSDLKAGYTDVLKEALALTDAQGQAFWPIQKEYEAELSKIADQRWQLIRDYAANYEQMTPETAKSLVDRAFKLDAARTSLLKKYVGKVSKKVSPVTAARFAQVESLVQSLIDVKLRAELPLVP